MKVHIYHAAAGYGHKRAALVLDKTLKDRGLSSTDFVQTADALDFTPAYFKKAYLSIYFNSVKYCPEAWGASYYRTDTASWIRWGSPIRAFGNYLHGIKLLHHVDDEKPDVIVNTHFFSAQLFAADKKRGHLNSHLITLITDSHPHRFWINDGTDRYWVMHQETADVLVQRGVSPDKITAGGIPVDDAFKASLDISATRKLYGMNPDLFTILLTSGSFGAGDYERVLKLLEAYSERIQCIVVCANNAELKQRLESKTFSYPVKILGFVNTMPELMKIADVLIAKSGGLTTSESLVVGTPMIVTQPIPGQETYNCEFLKRHNASFFAQDLQLIPIIIQNILQNPEMLALKKSALKLIAKPNANNDLANYILGKGFSHAPKA